VIEIPPSRFPCETDWFDNRDLALFLPPFNQPLTGCIGGPPFSPEMQAFSFAPIEFDSLRIRPPRHPARKCFRMIFLLGSVLTLTFLSLGSPSPFPPPVPFPPARRGHNSGFFWVFWGGIRSSRVHGSPELPAPVFFLYQPSFLAVSALQLSPETRC